MTDIFDTIAHDTVIAARGRPARPPLDIISLAIMALADVPLSPERRLREVACLAIAMSSHEHDYRAAGVDDEEIEEGCKTMGRLSARAARMQCPVEA